MNDLAPKASTQTAQHPNLPLPFTWVATTCPEAPVSLPVEVEIEIREEVLDIHLKRKSHSANETTCFQFRKGEVVGAHITIRPDVDLFKMSAEESWEWDGS